MRAGIETWLLGTWYGTRQPPWYLRLLEPMYRAAHQRAKTKAQAGASVYRPALPLIVVGNITVGGSGKTPLVIRLCQLAIDMGFKPGIASTGYGRQSRETLLVEADSDTRLCGDEPVLLAQRTGVPVVVAASRSDAVKRLNEMSLDLVFSDDGLQQADLERDIEFCVVDGERGMGNGHLIPAGPLRESAERLRKVDFVVSNGEWSGKPDSLEVGVMQLHAGVVRLLNDGTECSVEEFRHNNAGIEIHAVAGIGNPGRFFRMLEKLGIKANPHGFPDHYSFTCNDFDSIGVDSVIIMTEKDAVKCRSLGLVNAWYMPVETRLSIELEHLFQERLASLMKDSK